MPPLLGLANRQTGSHNSQKDLGTKRPRAQRAGMRMTRQPTSGGVRGTPLQLRSVLGKQLLPWPVAVVVFVESLDTTILNTAVPVVSQALNVAALSMKSVLASYTLSLAVFIPISGSYLLSSFASTTRSSQRAARVCRALCISPFGVLAAEELYGYSAADMFWEEASVVPVVAGR
jgi:hypothetical protein